MIEQKEVAKVIIAVAPAIQADRGDIEFVKIDGTKVHIKLTGACMTCPTSSVTLKEGIERIMKQRIPEVTEVINDNQTFFSDGTLVEL